MSTRVLVVDEEALFVEPFPKLSPRCPAILTRMGNDSADGMRLLNRGESLNIAQDEASCVVVGMPREAIQAAVADTVVPRNKIAETIVRAMAEVRA
jgi:two-component system, chemotaxis family, protein-glutamate methylesterase/glutaminase